MFCDTEPSFPSPQRHIQDRLSIARSNQNPKHSIDLLAFAQQTKPKKKRKEREERKQLAESIDLGVYFDPDSYISNSAFDCIGKYDLSHVYTS